MRNAIVVTGFLEECHQRPEGGEGKANNIGGGAETLIKNSRILGRFLLVSISFSLISITTILEMIAHQEMKREKLMSQRSPGTSQWPDSRGKKQEKSKILTILTKPIG